MVLCVCGSKVVNLKRHEKTKKHLNFINGVDTKHKHCSTCDKNISKKNWNKHIATDIHKSGGVKVSVDPNKKIKCSCGSLQYPRNMKRHKQSDLHRRKSVKKEKYFTRLEDMLEWTEKYTPDLPDEELAEFKKSAKELGEKIETLLDKCLEGTDRDSDFMEIDDTLSAIKDKYGLY